MQLCVGPDMSWLNFVGRRPFPLEEDGEHTISKLCPIGERLTNLVQNYSAEAFQQINDLLEGFSLVTLSDEVYLSWRSSIQVQIFLSFTRPSYTFAFLAKLPKPRRLRFCGVSRGLCAGSRAALRGPSSHLIKDVLSSLAHPG